jgi:protein-disulfide isomerase
MSPANTFPPRHKSGNQLFWALLPVVFLLGLGSGWLIWGRSQAAAAAQAKDAQAVRRYEVATDNDPAVGPQDAPVTIVEFSDYQCPYCQRWYSEVYAKLLSTYKDKVRFVYRDFPLKSIHPNAQSAAEAADCAGEQDAYWQYHDALFNAKYGLGTQAYLQYATDLELDVNAFTTCVQERRYKSEVDADFSYATELGINSTPIFFVNGIAVVGAQPFEVFQQVIDKELADKINQ